MPPAPPDPTPTNNRDLGEGLWQTSTLESESNPRAGVACDGAGEAATVLQCAEASGSIGGGDQKEPAASKEKAAPKRGSSLTYRYVRFFTARLCR